VDEAQRHAKREAIAQVSSFLKNQEPPIRHWKPSEHYLEGHLLDGPGRPGADVPLDNLGTGRSWELSLRAPDLAEFLRLDRLAQQRHEREVRGALRHSRLPLAAWLFGFVLTALLTITSYVRLRRVCHRACMRRRISSAAV
jgi:hypothetical protein